ncbi:hypothetical protein [Lacrimispora brassicae]
MKKKVFGSLMIIAALVVIVFITYSVVTVKEINMSTGPTGHIENTQAEIVTELNTNDVKQDIGSSLVEVDVTEEANKEMEFGNTGMTSKNVNTVWQSVSDDDVMVRDMQKDMSKEGVYVSELGLYWDRGRIQGVLYTDVQDLCEEAFGDYLSPLQGLTEMVFAESDRYRTRFRTDNQTAIMDQDTIKFFLFFPNDIAVVCIEDRGETYYTTLKVLSEKESEGIKVLEIPPTGGIGIAGTGNIPVEKNYETHSVITDISRIEYSKADIQLVFDQYIQRVTDMVFSDYTQALQGLFILLEQEGFGESVGIEETVASVMFGNEFQTTIAEENYLEFTLNLTYQTRARVTITKKGDQYITTFRLLKEGEFETEVQAG